MYSEDIKKITKNNTNYRQVLYTGATSQLVIMSIPVSEEIGEEVHEQSDQILFFVEGHAQVSVDGDSNEVKENDVVFVKAGSKHNVKNVGDEELKLFTVYAPATHPDGLVEAKKGE